mgnify:FL=1
MKYLALILYGVAIIIFLCLSFFFSSADMAYGSVDILRFDVESKKNPKKKGILRAKELAKNYDKTIATILFGNDVVNAGLDSVATLFGVNLCMMVLSDNPNVSQISETWGLVASLTVLVLKITFGEIVPKSISKINNFKMSISYASIINVVRYIFMPITYPVALLGGLFAKTTKDNVEDVQIAEDDLHEMVDDIEEQGTVDEEKASMLHETIKYTHTEAKEVMTPRVEMEAIDINDSIETILKEGKVLRYSRVPVYEDTIDNIIGFIRSKTFMIKCLSQEDFKLQDILLTPLRFPQSAEINDIMRQFKKTKTHFAVIMDEYGGVDGILTMEDILEEIVGEIWDEKDRPKDPVVERKDGSYIIDGNVTLEDFCDLFSIPFDDVNSDYLTVGGFVVELLDDQFAKIGDEVDFEGIHIKVIAIDDNGAVEKIIAQKKKEEE